LQGVFGGFWDEGVGVCGLGDVLRDVDVDYSEAVGDCPVDIREETVILFRLVLFYFKERNG
jgi:hypothetical protein